MRVGILGGGRWGEALARLVLAAGHDPFLAYRKGDRRPPHVLPSSDDPPKVAEACGLLIVATSAAEVRNAIRLARPSPSHRIVVAGRGIDPATSDWLTDAVLQECDAVRVGALAGPAPVDEILNGGLCAGVVASRHEEVRTETVEALHSSRYRCYETSDLTGVQLAGAAMPVLATMLGLALDLRGAGVGMHGMVLSRGMAETVRLADAIGADRLTFLGLAGTGDLVAAQARPGQPHFDAGRALAVGRKPASDAPERLARALRALARLRRVETPLLDALVEVFDGSPPIDAVGRLMRRESRAEFE
jgi:glycerol-3-phosphate dehydrogenase (NAD(P)+)